MVAIGCLNIGALVSMGSSLLQGGVCETALDSLLGDGECQPAVACSDGRALFPGVPQVHGQLQPLGTIDHR